MMVSSLNPQIKGEFHTAEHIRRLYATDASAYREIPMAVAIPIDNDDLIALVNFTRENGLSLIPRTAGTSLAGQVVGPGIVVDISKNFDKVIEINTREEYVIVQPGIVRDDLNKALKGHGYFFAPETSTANRAMIGGMIGNNSCGANSVVYGSTREHLLEVNAILADGSQAWFGPLEAQAFIARCNGQGTTGSLHTGIYYTLHEMLKDAGNQKTIRSMYPDPAIPRRNTGYALDMLLRHRPYDEDGSAFNLCSLLAGSEGTLALITDAKLKISKLPSEHKLLVCIHCHSIDEALRANLVALKYSPSACELMDHYILEATERSLHYRQLRFFLEGDPQAILVVEVIRDSEGEVTSDVRKMVKELSGLNLGYAHPVIKGPEMTKVWELRKAGLGLLSNVPGDAKPAPVIEDTAVKVQDLPQYIAEFNAILKKHDLYSVHYAHAGSGELHLRPILNLKTPEGRKAFRMIAEEIADLVKKYKGSLSGEHGDGRLRGEFIPKMLGEQVYKLCREVKAAWDPNAIFNPGKIVDTPPMDTSLRFDEGQETTEINTRFDFSSTQGFIRAAEQCNGSGDCRKTHLSGGTMCPSYMATREEKDTTRARANILREMLTKSESDPFTSSEVADVMDLCLSCKGCKSECPSNVDVGKMKAEWYHQYYQRRKVPFRTRLIGHYTTGMKLASLVPSLHNAMFKWKLSGNILKSIMGFAPERSMPLLQRSTLRTWYDRNQTDGTFRKGRVYLFCDEFTNYHDVEVGRKTILLLNKLGYDVKLISHEESGRTYLSKGMLDKALRIAEKNTEIFHELISTDTPLVGIEPSAILTFRDEYIELQRGEAQQRARDNAEHVFTIEEFIDRERESGRITREMFHQEEKTIKLHGHCHQKALSSIVPSKRILQIPGNYKVEAIPSGCCGMAGSFGYEKEHYDLSMKIGELVLFPAVRSAGKGTLIAASGTSCRHQIMDGTDVMARHPVEILYDAAI